MGNKTKSENITAKVREVKVRRIECEAIAQAMPAIGVIEQTFYLWRREHGSLRIEPSTGYANKMWGMLDPSRPHHCRFCHGHVSLPVIVLVDERVLKHDLLPIPNVQGFGEARC